MSKTDAKDVLVEAKNTVKYRLADLNDAQKRYAAAMEHEALARIDAWLDSYSTLEESETYRTPRVGEYLPLRLVHNYHEAHSALMEGLGQFIAKVEYQYLCPE